MKNLAAIVSVADVAHLNFKARRNIEDWLKVLAPLRNLPSGGLLRAIAAISENTGHPAGTIKKKYYALRDHGPMALLDKRLAGPAHWNTLQKGVPREAISLWKELCEKNKRKCKPAHDELVKMWIHKDARLARIFPGFPGHPNLPAGLKYRTLMHKKNKPTAFELTTARIGTSAARQMLPKTLTSRVGIEPGQIYMPDDQDYDVNIAVVGHNPRMTRSAGFNCLDYSSGDEFAFGIKPTILNADGTKQKLKQIDYQWFIVHILTTVGYRADLGTLFIDENGTANAGDDFEVRVARATDDKVSFDSSGIYGKQLPGMFRGAAHGNPGFKAARESLFNLIRNKMGASAGQTGMDRHHAPEENHGLDKYVRDLLTLAKHRPELAEVLQFPIPRWTDFIFFVSEIVREINGRTDHNLEGWERMGRTVAEWRLTYDQPWLPESKYLALPDTQRGVVDTMVRQSPDLWRYRKMSPQEVWDAHKHKLTRVAGSAIPVLLGEQGARPAIVTDDHQIVIKDKELDGEPMWFDSILTNGRVVEQGAPLLVYLNPYDACRIQVCDRAGCYLGEAPIVNRIGKLETETIIHRHGKIQKIASRLQAPVIQRARKDVKERTNMLEHNAKLAAGIPINREQKALKNETESAAKASLRRRAAKLAELENI